MKIVIADPLPSSAADLLRDEGLDVDAQTGRTPEELSAALADADAPGSGGSSGSGVRSGSSSAAWSFSRATLHAPTWPASSSKEQLSPQT